MEARRIIGRKESRVIAAFIGRIGERREKMERMRNG
jgi:hypothetical protein